MSTGGLGPKETRVREVLLRVMRERRWSRVDFMQKTGIEPGELAKWVDGGMSPGRPAMERLAACPEVAPYLEALREAVRVDQEARMRPASGASRPVEPTRRLLGAPPPPPSSPEPVDLEASLAAALRRLAHEAAAGEAARPHAASRRQDQLARLLLDMLDLGWDATVEALGAELTRMRTRSGVGRGPLT